MTVKESHYEGQTNGATVTAANSADFGDEPIPSGQLITNGGTITYSSAHAHTGTGAIRVLCNGSASSTYFGYGAAPAPDASFRAQIYIWLDVLPTASMRLCAITTTASSTLGRIQLSTAGVPSLIMTGTSTAGAGMNTGQWNRIDIFGSGFNSAASAVTANFWDGPDDTTTPLATASLSGQTTTGLVGRVNWGNCSAVNVGNADMTFDDHRSEIGTSSTPFDPYVIAAGTPRPRLLISSAAAGRSRW